MKRFASGVVGWLAVVVVAGALAGACNDDTDGARCDGDADCGTGSVCRDGTCAALPDAQAPGADASPTCAAESAACTVDQDCCAGRCETSRCTTTPRPTTPPRCVAVLGACLTTPDCCAPLTCQSGTCR